MFSRALITLLALLVLAPVSLVGQDLRDTRLLFGPQATHDPTCECPRVNLADFEASRPSEITAEIRIDSSNRVRGLRITDRNGEREQVALYEDYREGLPMRVRYRLEISNVIVAEYRYERWTDGAVPKSRYEYSDSVRGGQVIDLAYQSLNGSAIAGFPTETIPIAFVRVDGDVVRTLAGTPETDIAICRKQDGGSANCDWQCAIRERIDDSANLKRWVCYDLSTHRSGPPLVELLPDELSTAFSQAGRRLSMPGEIGAVDEIQTSQDTIQALGRRWVRELMVYELPGGLVAHSQLSVPTSGASRREYVLTFHAEPEAVAGVQIEGDPESLTFRLPAAVQGSVVRILINGVATSEFDRVTQQGRLSVELRDVNLFPRWNTAVLAIDGSGQQPPHLYTISFLVNRDLSVQ